MLQRFPLFALGLFTAFAAQAQVLSPKGQEIEISYQTSFILGDDEEDLESATLSHSNYLMGVIKGANFVERMGVSFESSEGIGAPRLPLKISGIKTFELADGRTEVSYKYRAKALIHKNAAKKILKKGSFDVVLPYDLEKVYDKKCTDAHYTSFGDYWYFWDPYRVGCENLLKEPATRQVEVFAKELVYKKVEENTRLDLLRADNGNGKILQIDIINGFDKDTAKKDIGWKIFRNLNLALERNFEFELSKKAGSTNSPVYTFEKTLASGVKVVLRSIVVDTAAESRSKAFAKFFKNSVENADVIIYSGHSGLGGNLDIPTLEEKAGAFKFNPKKRQLFFFNSCSSYSYYLDSFRSEKTKARIDVLTNALASYMDEDSLETQTLLEALLDESQSPQWVDLMDDMEKSSSFGMTYLLNVGGV